MVEPRPGPCLCDPWSALAVQRLARRRALAARRRAASVPVVDRASSEVLVLQVAPLQVAPLTTRRHRCLVVQLVLAVGPLVVVDRRQEVAEMVQQICIHLGPSCGSVLNACSPSGSFGIPSVFPICRTIGTSWGRVSVTDSSSRLCLHMLGIPDRLVVVL